MKSIFEVLTMTGSSLTLLDVQPRIPGCDDVPYSKPTSPLKAGAWFWDVDKGTPAGPIPLYQFQWGNFALEKQMEKNGKGGTKEAVFEDLKNNNAASLKKQVGMRLDAIDELNKSIFQKNADGDKVYFDLSYVYSEDIALVYSLKQFGYASDEIEGESVIYFESANSADYVQGVIRPDGQSILTDDGKVIELGTPGTATHQKNSDNLHLKSSFDFVGYYLKELSDRGIGADFSVAFDLVQGKDPKTKKLIPREDALEDTLNSMRLAARYNVYAENEGLTKYNYFNIDNEPGENENIQEFYLEINDEITGLFGPGTDFDFDIAAYVNQAQMLAAEGQVPFAGLVAENAESLIFATYRRSPEKQCEGFDILINPSSLGYAKDSIWTMAWEGSVKPHQAKPLSPLTDLESVMDMRKMADIAIAQAGYSEILSGNPMLINQNPEVSFSSFLPIYVQLVHGQGF